MEIFRENQVNSQAQSFQTDLPETQFSSTKDSEFRSQYDKVVRGLASEVEDQRRMFDKKWQMLMQYLLRKHEEQEQTIRKLKSRLSQYENQSNDDFGQRSLSQIQVSQKRISDPFGIIKHDHFLKAQQQTHQQQNIQKQDETPDTDDIQNFDQLQKNIMMSRTDQEPFRSRRVYSLGTSFQKRSSIKENQAITSRLIKDQDFIEVLKSQLLQAKQIIVKDQNDKTILVKKLKEMKQQLTKYEQEQATVQQDQKIDIQEEQHQSQDREIVTKQSIKTQTEHHHNYDHQESKGVNTSFIQEQTLQHSMISSSSQLQIKVLHDEFEETRLRENINFWKDKVDLLLQEKKEALHDQMSQHKIIRNYEQQIEELKSQLRSKDDYIECLQIEKNLMNQRLSMGIPEHRQSRHTIQLNQDNNDNERQIFSEDTTPKLDQKESVLSDVQNEQDGNTPYINQPNWILTVGNSSDQSHEYPILSNNNSDKKTQFHNDSSIQSQFYDASHNKNSSNHSTNSSIKKKPTKKLSQTKLKKNNYLNPQPQITKNDLLSQNLIQASGLTSNSSSALKTYDKRNYDIINRASLNQIYGKLSSTKMPLTSQQVTQQQQQLLQQASQLKHIRHNSNTMSNLHKQTVPSRDQSLTANRNTKSQVGIQKDSSRNTITQGNIGTISSSNSITSKVSSTVYKSNQPLKSNQSSERKKSQVSSRVRSKSKGKINNNFNKMSNQTLIDQQLGQEKIQVIESHNEKILEAVIQTVQSHQNQTIVEVLERLQKNEEEEQYNLNIDSSSNNNDNHLEVQQYQYMSPTTHAQQLLKNFKRQENATKMVNSFIEGDKSGPLMIESRASSKQNHSKNSRQHNQQPLTANKNIVTNYSRHNMLTNKNQSNISISNNTNNTLIVNHSNSQLGVYPHSSLPIQQSNKKEYRQPFL